MAEETSRAAAVARGNPVTSIWAVERVRQAGPSTVSMNFQD